MFISHEGVSSGAKGFLNWDYVHSMSVNECWKSEEWFGLSTLRSHEFEFLLNFWRKHCNPL